MPVQQLFTSRINSANASTYVGDQGRMFYNESTGELRLSDGSTPGGTTISVVANVITTGSLLPSADNLYSIGTSELRWSHIHLDSAAATIYFSANTLGLDSSGSLSYNNGTGNVAFGNITFRDTTVQSTAYTPSAIYSNLLPGTSNTYDIGSLSYRWGNVYVGPFSIHLQDQTTLNDVEMTVNSGTLFLNGAQNIAVGNLVIEDTTLKNTTTGLDISIGETDDTGSFFAKRKTQINNTTFGTTEAMVSMNASGVAAPATIFPDTLIQTVSRPNRNSRIVQRSYGSSGDAGGDNSYAVWASYSARGNISNPQAIKQNDILSRISSNGYGTTTWGTGGTRIETIALENFTDSAKGSKINFWTTPVGSITSQQVASVTSTGISANAIIFSTDSTTQTTAGIPLTQRAVANGVATLGIDGRLSTDQIPSSLVGAIVFQGGWNAANNTPTLSNGTGVTGYQYIVTIGGTQNLGAGNVTYVSGDTVTYGGNVWNRVEASSPISSVSGNLHMQVSPTTGAVVVGIDATPNAVIGTVVSRDASGNFQANTITASLAGQATSALTAATVSAGAQPSITSVGTLTSLIVSGNISAGNVSGTNGVFTRVAGTLTTATQPNITTVGTLGSLTVTGNVTAGNVNSNTFGTHVGAVTGNITGTILTAVQPNITSIGTLGALSVTGNITAGNVNAKVTGNVTGTASTATSLTAASSILAGNLAITPTAIGKNATSTQTFTLTGLTTNHKVVVTSASDLAYGVIITAARASASDTLSVQFTNLSGGGITPAAMNLQYFAWV